jgi:hypothetical protein
MSSRSQGYWNGQYADQPVRLLITCRREGHEPWAVLCEVKAQQAGGPFERASADESVSRLRSYR